MWRASILGGRGLRSSPREAALVTIVRIILSYRTRHRVTSISVSGGVVGIVITSVTTNAFHFPSNPCDSRESLRGSRCSHRPM